MRCNMLQAQSPAQIRRSVHFFPAGDHRIARSIQDAGPATVVLDETVAAAVPGDGRHSQSGEFQKW